MTSDEFLKSRPMDHPDFIDCDQWTGHPSVPATSLPNLVALIRRMGGLDAIPDDNDDRVLRGVDRPYFSLWDSMPDRMLYGAFLRDCESHRAYARLLRLGENVVISGWHPCESNLTITFSRPADWTAGAWPIALVQIDGVYSSTAELDALVAISCDEFIGAIQKATETYCLIRRDVFRP
jgi:hypothetical protein